MSKKQDSKNQRIQVFARCRPLNSIERKQCSPSVVEVIPEKKEIVLRDKNHHREFFFDKVFPADSEQISVYKAVVAPLIQEVLNGYNCTVFAYGQTGTGKTYTMEGGERDNSKCSWEEDPSAGIIPRSLHQLFEELNKEENVEFSVRVSFLELYNEELFDLLSSNELSRLRLFEDSSKKGSVIIQGLEEIMVNTKDEVYAILERGTSRRQTAATLLNAASSRSHTVFSVTVHIKENTIEGEELLKTGKLNLVDLAGSENVGRSGAVDKRAREAGNINQSLLTLGRVITALIEKQPHVPYRESKLTRLLQDSLGGHTKTSIIATISPALCNFEETLSTLDYATKAKSITIRPEVNQKMTKRALIREYAEEIERLRRDLVALRSKEGFFVDQENYNNMLVEIEKKTEVVKELSDKIDLLKEENIKIEQAFICTKNELSQTSEQLCETKKRYEETASELSEKTDILNVTRKVLSERTLQRDEKQFIVGVQSLTEKKLTQQAQQLRNVADESTNDVEKLHDKILRKQLVESTNQEKLQNLRTMFQQQCSKYDKIISDTESKELANLHKLKTDFGILENSLKSYHCETSSILKVLVHHCASNLSHVSSELESQSEKHTEMDSLLLQDLIDKKNMQLARQNSFMRKTLPHLIGQINLMNNEMISSFLKVHQELLQMIDTRKSIVDQRAETQRNLLNSIQESINLFHVQHQEALQNLRERNSKLSAVNDNLKKHYERGFELFLEAEEKTSKAQECYASFESSITVLKESENPIQVILQTTDNNQENDAKYFSDFSGIMDAHKMTTIDFKESSNQKFENISTELEELFNESEKSERSTLEEIKSKFDLHRSLKLKGKKIMLTDLQKMKCDVEEAVQNKHIHLHEKNEELQSFVIKTSNIIPEFESLVQNHTAVLTEEIQKQETEFEKFISNEIVHDVPTGITPQRKSYVYPKVLAATSPESRLMQRFHSNQAENSIAVNLPLDSSFDESEESKNSPNSTNSGASDSVSSTLDEVDCEADSYASSVSDAGEEEKENQRRKKKISRLPKKLPATKVFKNKDFVKPATPPKKKPLCFMNSSSENVL